MVHRIKNYFYKRMVHYRAIIRFHACGVVHDYDYDQRHTCEIFNIEEAPRMRRLEERGEGNIDGVNTNNDVEVIIKRSLLHSI